MIRFRKRTYKNWNRSRYNILFECYQNNQRNKHLRDDFLSDCSFGTPQFPQLYLHYNHLLGAYNNSIWFHLVRKILKLWSTITIHYLHLNCIKIRRFKYPLFQQLTLLVCSWYWCFSCTCGQLFFCCCWLFLSSSSMFFFSCGFLFLNSCCVIFFCCGWFRTIRTCRITSNWNKKRLELQYIYNQMTLHLLQNI